MRVLVVGKRRALNRAHLLLHLVGVILLSSLTVLWVAQPASAHAELLSTTPEDGAALEHAPAEAVFTFNEPVQLLDGSIRLVPGDETPITLDAHVSNTEVVASLPAELANGSYALSYQVASADGHPISGAITFTVGHADDPTPAPAVDLRTPPETELAVRVLTALQYLTLLTFAGLVFFDGAIRRGTRSSAGRAGGVLRGTSIGAAAASVLLIPVSALNVAGSPLLDLFSPTVWWRGVLWAPVAAASLVLLGVAGTHVLRTRVSTSRSGQILGTAAPLLAVVAPVLVGHTQLVEPRVLIVLADIGHLLAGSFWTGGVLGLLLFLGSVRPRAQGEPSGPGPIPAMAVVERFSRFAMWSVILLALSGTLMGVLIIGSVQHLVTTAYGVTLLVKVGIVAVVVAIAGYNRLRLLPALSSRPTARQQWQLLMRTLTAEAVLLVAIIAVTGFLTNLSPAHHEHAGTAAAHEATGPVAVSGHNQGLAVEGLLEPASTGENHMTFSLRHEGEPLTSEDVAVEATLPAHDLGPFQIAPELDAETGEYSAQLPLPVAGEWQLQVTARVSTFTEPIVTIPVTIR